MKYSRSNYQKRISYGMQYISSADVKSVKESLKDLDNIKNKLFNEKINFAKNQMVFQICF